MNLEVNSINSSFNSVGYTNLCRPNFRAETSEKAGFLSAPIETVNKVIEVPLDTFVKQDKHRSEVLKDKLGSRAETREKKKKVITDD